MRLLGISLLVATCLLGVLKYDHISIWSAGVGVALGVGLFLALITDKPEEVAVPPDQQNNPWQVRFLDLQAQTNQTIENLNTESKKLQQKLVRAEERCTSYQKLVDVHQGEIDQLKRESTQIGQQIIASDRKVAELQLAKLEPDLFDAEKRQTESSYRELKKQFDEKSQALEQARIRLFRVESELLLVQKEKKSNPASRVPPNRRSWSSSNKQKKRRESLKPSLSRCSRLFQSYRSQNPKPARKRLKKSQNLTCSVKNNA
jgi:hypothetical protein